MIFDGIPVAVLFFLATLFGFVLTPILNTETRTNEHKADIYGLNVSRQPAVSRQPPFTLASAVR
jgi:Zn-dependent protease with chaperone function